MEKVFSYGSSIPLTGILSEPTSPPTHTRPTVVILNAGLVHHVGPHRTTVELARAITANGFNVFRFDLSAIGDSKTRKSRLGYRERATQEIQETMDFLSDAHKGSTFILAGLCTGADFTHQTAVKDDRVVGCIFMDGYAYPTTHFHYLNLIKKAKNLLRKVFNAEKWSRYIRRKTSSQKKHTNPKSSVDNGYNWTLPEKAQSAEDYILLVDRKVNLFFIFTASESKSINYQNQISDSFKHVNFSHFLRVDIFPLSDHTFTFLSQREKMMSNVCSWLIEKHPADQSHRD